jgi:hypothetical protein
MGAPRNTWATASARRIRKRIEECFGWLKMLALLRKVRHRGTLTVDRGPDVYLRLCGLQFGAHEKPDGHRGSSAVSPSGSVSGQR